MEYMKKHRPENVRKENPILKPKCWAFRKISRSTKDAQVEI
jgi:hypothetical protein